MKSILLSIKPKYCELIASGKKTVEVRKTRPKIETPFKVYIYQTRKPDFVTFSGTGRHISEYEKTLYYTERSGKVIGEFVCDKVYDITPHYDIPSFCNQYVYGWKIGEAEDCISFDDLDFYLGGKKGYGWHITDLVIYDKPKELSEFERACPDNVRSCAMCRHSGYTGMKCLPINKPPQSWFYIEEVEA